MTKPAQAAVTPVIAAATPSRRFCRMRHPSTNACSAYRYRTDFAYKHRTESSMDCNHPCEGLTFYGHTTEGARQHGWATFVAQGAKEVTTGQIDSECSNRVRVIFGSSSPNRADLAGGPRQRGRPRSPAHRSSKQRIPHPRTKQVRQRLARTRAGTQGQTELYAPGTSSKCQNGHFQWTNAPTPTDYKGCTGEGNSSTTLFPWVNYSADHSARAITGLTTRPRRPQAKIQRPRVRLSTLRMTLHIKAQYPEPHRNHDGL